MTTVPYRIPNGEVLPFRGRPPRLFMEDRAPLNPVEHRILQLRETYLSRLPGRHIPPVKELAERAAGAQVEVEVAEALYGTDHYLVKQREQELARLIDAMRLEHDAPLQSFDDEADDAV